MLSVSYVKDYLSFTGCFTVLRGFACAVVQSVNKVSEKWRLWNVKTL